ncbi:Shedu anti-phage system protein SduA domain-containing protein [Kribbella sp. NPDC048915]|uniref:Shedu anti-phage system protein SduA domain-containing protein n=1 Tax=Kribbella sp. NPDC048915 TaxID=3155148 RepID=UPI0033DDD04C
MNGDDEFKIWVANEPVGPGQMGGQGATIKVGPLVCKTVRAFNYGDRATGEVKRQELRFSTYRKRRNDPGYDFDNPESSWTCENEEIPKLIAFLSSQVSETGRYRVVDSQDPTAGLIDLFADSVNVDQLAAALRAHSDLPSVLELLASTDEGRAASEIAVLARRRQLVAELQTAALSPTATETSMQKLIGEAYWLFGGRYSGIADRRNLTALDQHDIPLLGADGTLHVVELKGPVIPKLVKRHRNHWIVGNDVHEATAQAMNYLRSLDEQGMGLSKIYESDLGEQYDFRRVFATVVIGHPHHVPEVPEHLIDQTVRSYNAHLSRIEVVTYKNLFDAAEKALEFEQSTQELDGQPPFGDTDDWLPGSLEEPPF